MDYSLIALIGAMVVTILLSLSWNNRGRHGRPGSEYHRVFSTAAVGLLFTVAGATGWDLSHSHGWFQGTKRIGGLIWWEIALGVAFLAVAVLFARRVPSRPAAR